MDATGGSIDGAATGACPVHALPSIARATKAAATRPEVWAIRIKSLNRCPWDHPHETQNALVSVLLRVSSAVTFHDVLWLPVWV